MKTTTYDNVTFLQNARGRYAVRLRYEIEEDRRKPAYVSFWLYKAFHGKLLKSGGGEPIGTDQPSESRAEASGVVKFDGCINLNVETHTCDGMGGHHCFSGALWEALLMCDRLMDDDAEAPSE
jgi:hypothetical protein